ALPDQSKGADYTVRQLLDDSAPRMSDQLKGQPEVDAAISAAIGGVYRRLGLPDKAEPHLQRALAIRRPLAASKSPGAVAQLAQSLLDYGWNLRYAQRLPDAERHLREAVELFKKSGADHGKTLDAMSTLQVILHEQSRYDEATAVANEALMVGGQLFPQGHAELANITHRLAHTKHLQRDLPTAEALGRQAVTMHERWHGNDHVETGWSLCHLGNIQIDRQQYAESETNLKRARLIFLAQYGHGHYSVPMVMDALTRLYKAKGDDAALAALQADHRAGLLKSLERDASNLKLQIELGDSLRQSGDVDGALAKYDEVLERRTPATSPDVIERLAEGYVQLSALLCGKQRSDQAARAYEQAIALRGAAEGAPPEVRFKQSSGYHALAFSLLLTKPVLAEQAVRKAVELRGAVASDFPQNGEYQFHLAHSHQGLSDILKHTGRRPEALEELRRAAELLESLAAIDVTTAAPDWLPAETGHTIWMVGDRFFGLRDYDRAESLHRRALDIFQRLERAKPNEPFFRLEQGASYCKLAEVHIARGRLPEAREHYEMARRVYAQLIAQFPERPFYRQELAWTTWRIASTLAQAQRIDAAIAEYRSALTLHENAFADSPKDSILRDRQTEIRAELARLLVRTGSYEEAAATVADPGFAPSTWQAARGAAAALAGAIEAAQRDAKLSDERRAALVDAWKPQVDRLVAAAVQQCPATSLNDL
ncbi:MAG: tetratricopeptide repeat protein, partial [Pirellulales bacterium]|nr:tetratricopeptide repeat protein [Pirellulales bacterium]